MFKDLPGLELTKWLSGIFIAFVACGWSYLLFGSYYDSIFVFLEEEIIFLGGLTLIVLLGVHFAFRPFENFLSRLDSLNFYLQRIQRLGQEMQNCETKENLKNTIIEQTTEELPYDQVYLFEFFPKKEKFIFRGGDTNVPEEIEAARLKKITGINSCQFWLKLEPLNHTRPVLTLPLKNFSENLHFLCLYPDREPDQQNFHHLLGQRYQEQLNLAIHQINLLQREHKIQAELDQKIVKATEEIKAQQEFLKSIISNLETGLIVCSEDDKIKLINQQAASILEIEQPAELPVPLSEFRNSIPEKILAGREVNSDGTVEFRQKNLEYSWQETKLEKESILLLRDRTTKVKMRQQLEFNRSLSLLGEMAASVAHELRNPLGGLELYLGLLKRHAEAEQLDKPIKKLENGLQQVQRTVRGLLDFTRTGKPEFKSLDPNQLINNVLDYCQERLAENEVEVNNKLPDLTDISGDREQLRTLFVNLIQNAIEAQSTGRKIEISGKQNSEDVKIYIRDYGEGIPEGKQENIFDLFYSSKSSGTGLGLSICRRITQVHSGEIYFQPPPGDGSTFVVELPIEPKLNFSENLTGENS